MADVFMLDESAQRERAIAERERNVVLDAGAGTGKTSLLVERLVRMLAPLDDTKAAPSIDRLAAVTFTRRAAGQLRLRIRAALVSELVLDLSTVRRGRLKAALSGLDAAWIGTIHTFADRLLRNYPAEARLSPEYKIVEDEDSLLDETLERLRSGAAEDYRGEYGELGFEAAQTLRCYIDAGWRVETQYFETYSKEGFDALIKGMLRQRDLTPPFPALSELDLTRFRAVAEAFIDAVSAIAAPSAGRSALEREAQTLERVIHEADPWLISRQALLGFGKAAKDLQKGRDFLGDDQGWALYKQFAVQKPTLRQQIAEPVLEWIATRLVRLFPIAAAIYEEVKTEHRVVDTIDLLLRLRDLLRDHKTVRTDAQLRFEHLFVDELQDTDPLQAEIFLYLAERGVVADRWQDIQLRSGALTVVGDPKQSIYRFRRADISMYAQFRDRILQQGGVSFALKTNFRSVPPLIEWFNQSFDAFLGAGEPLFDANTGVVKNQRMAAPNVAPVSSVVRIIPFAVESVSRPVADESRAVEAEALAAYVRWLVLEKKQEVRDPLTSALRAARYDDVAVLALATTGLGPLFPALDRLDIPYVARGGRLFLEDPLHRQFLLALRVIADRHDGIAEAALMRPPFFAIDLAELAREKHFPPEVETTDAGILRVREARLLIQALRQERFNRPPGATARALVEETLFARTIARGSNGPQRLRQVYELCLEIDRLAIDEAKDFDNLTMRLRSWVTRPPSFDPAPPVGEEALQILTVHQAKGLEFPIVILWDGATTEQVPWPFAAWRINDRGEWSIGLSDFKHNEPRDLARGEGQMLKAERRRLVYVAATRARDLLVLPSAPTARSDLLYRQLATTGDAALVETLPAYNGPRTLPFVPKSNPPVWAQNANQSEWSLPVDDRDFEQELAASWSESARRSLAPKSVPRAITASAREESRSLRLRFSSDEGDEEALPLKSRTSRYGALFGDVVHQAIGLVLRGSLDVPSAVSRAAFAAGLAEHLDEAGADVARAIEALGSIGLARSPDASLQLEYPLGRLSSGGELQIGYADLIALGTDEIVLIDFKTAHIDRTSARDYAAQVHSYIACLKGAGMTKNKRVRAGLLLTESGRFLWLESSSVTEQGDQLL